MFPTNNQKLPNEIYITVGLVVLALAIVFAALIIAKQIDSVAQTFSNALPVLEGMANA